MRPVATDVAWSVYVLDKWSLPWALLKRLNWSRSRLGCGLYWVQGTMLGGSMDYSRKRAYCRGVILRIVQYSEYPVCCWYSQLIQLVIAEMWPFAVNSCNSWLHSRVMSVHCVVRLLYKLLTVGVISCSTRGSRERPGGRVLSTIDSLMLCDTDWRGEVQSTLPESTTSTMIWSNSDMAGAIPWRLMQCMSCSSVNFVAQTSKTRLLSETGQRHALFSCLHPSCRWG